MRLVGRIFSHDGESDLPDAPDLYGRTKLLGEVSGAGCLTLRTSMIGREFGHGHAQGDFSFHAALPRDLAAAAEQAGWAEPHFLVATGQVPPTIVMIYAPRDDEERQVVRDLIRASYEFAVTPDS